MFRPIRRKKNDIGEAAARQLLSTERRGVLALSGDDGYPYAVPLNFVYCEDENKIYFHGARSGYKVELLEKSDKVCFTVYGNIRIKDEEWAPYVQSAVVFGRCRLVRDQNRAIALVRRLAEKYYPSTGLIDEEIARSGNAVQLFEIEIEHVSGKEIKEK